MGDAAGNYNDFFPALNAGLNATAALLLALGYALIKRQRRDAHRNVMIAAFLVSSVFLTSYLYYHFNFDARRFTGSGLIKYLYLTMLISHILGAIALVPGVLGTLFFAYKKRWERHTRWSRIVWPLWMYISVTGVAIYFSLYESPSMSDTNAIKKKIFYLAAVTIFLTFMMIVLGGVVKNTGSSLACPDWPTCHGSLMPEMKGPVAIEHSHRILGTILGLLAAALALFSAKIRKEDPCLHRAAILSFVLVVIQGVMGGATVLTKITPLYSTIHLALSHIFFAVLLYIYFRTCDEPRWPAEIPRKLIKLSGIATALVFIQILLGGIVRHYGAGPACGLGWEASLLCQELTTAKLTLWPMNGPGQLHMLHRLNGFLTLFALIGLTIPTLKFARLNQLKSLRRHLIGIHLVVTVQVLLGIKVVGTHIAPLAITLHLAFGLTLWALTSGLTIKLKGKCGR